MTQTTDAAACSPDDVVITRELETRPNRAPDYEGENRALRALAEAMSTAPDTVLQRLVEMAMALTRSDSAGISLLEPGGANGSFRWVATTGAWSPSCNGTMPREASPCGEVIAQRSILLMKDPARAFPALLQAEPGVGEALLAPFAVGEVPAGTLWVIKHGPDEHFQTEDTRLLESLAGFASAAHRTVQALRMAESAGQHAEARLEDLVTLAEVSSEFIGTCGMNFMPTYANVAAMRMVGLTDLEQVKQTPLSEFFFPEDLAFITDEFFPRVLREGHGKVEIRFRHFVTGEPVWVDYSLVVLNDAMGRPIGLGTVTHDLTERKRAEIALQVSEARFRALATVGSSSVYRMSPDWREMRQLDGAAFLTDTNEATADWVDVYIPPDERPRVREAISRVIADKDVLELEHRVLRADGTIGWTFSRAIPLFDDGGEISEWFGAATDVTARVKADQRFTRLFWASPAPFMILKPDAPHFTIAEVNDAYLSATMRTRDEVVGRGIFEAYPDNPFDETIGGVSALRASLERVLTSRQPDKLPGLKYDIARPDGTFEERCWSPVNSAVLDDEGEVEALIHNANDVTSERQAEVRLRESEERQVFLLRLSDTLRSEPSPEAMSSRALRMLLEHMRLDRCYIGIYRLAEDIGHFPHQVHNEGLPPLPNQVRLSDFPEALQIASSRTLVIDDVMEMEGLADSDRASFDSLGLRSLINATLRKGENTPLWAIIAASTRPRKWTRDEIALVEEVTERTWAALERARAEAARIETEEKFSALFDNMAEGLMLFAVVRGSGGEIIDLIYRAANKAMEHQAGFDRAKIIGQLFTDIVTPADAERWTSIFARVFDPGEPVALEEYSETVDRWFSVSAYPHGENHIAVFYTDITERKRAEAALRESEERQAFLLRLSDALRPLADPNEVQSAAAQLLGEHLKADRAHYYEVDADGIALARQGYSNGGITLPKKIRIADLGQQWLDSYSEGRNVVVSDIATDERASDEERAAWRASGLCGALGVPLVKGGRFCALLGFNTAQPRHWTDAEIALVEEVAERTWAAVERAGAEAALRESEERFRSVTEVIDDVFYMTDLDQGALLYLSPSFERVWGMPPTDVLRDLSNFANSIHPEDRLAAGAAMAAQQQGQPAEAEYRIIRPDGEIRWIHDRCFPVPSNGGRRSAGVASDITARKVAEAALRDSEALFRQFNEFSSDVIWIRDAETMQFDYVSPAIEAIYGVAPEEFASRHNDLKAWAEIVHPDDRAKALDGFRRVRAGERVTHEFRIQRDDGEIRWIRDTDFPLIDDQGRVQRVAGIGQDITERKRGDERQKMLLAELQHRVRNILAMIRSVTVRSAETAESVEDYCQHLAGRIGTMARTQSLLTRHIGGGVDLQNMILDELNAQAAPNNQFIVTGPDVALPPKAAEVLGLAVHELATNAVKYGAFDAKGGSVDVRWALLAGEPVPKLSFIWSEFGVRIDDPPTHRGFGTELITERVPYELQGIGNMEFRNSGLVATIEFPLIDAASILQTDPGRFDSAS